MLVKVDESLALDMLMDRVKYWTDDEEVYHLYEAMYENYVYDGVFEGREFDVMAIVDNDYINYCEVIGEGDESYEDIKKLFDEQGCGDISCEHELNHGYNYIESEYHGYFLVRI